MLLCSSSRSSSDGPREGSPVASLLSSGDPEQREGSDSALDPSLESGNRDLRKAHMGAGLGGTGLRAPGRSAVARAEDSAEDAASLAGLGGGGGRRARGREPPKRGHTSIVSPL